MSVSGRTEVALRRGGLMRWLVCCVGAGTCVARGRVVGVYVGIFMLNVFLFFSDILFIHDTMDK